MCSDKMSKEMADGLRALDVDAHAGQAPAWPCHRKPKGDWCVNQPNFQGHTCTEQTGWENATQGLKFDQDKPRMDLLDAYAIEQLALVLGFGAQKYAANNWRKGISYGRLLAAILRHAFAILRGEWLDGETGLSHAAHIQCTAMFLTWMGKHRPDMNDLWRDQGLVPEISDAIFGTDLSANGLDIVRKNKAAAAPLYWHRSSATFVELKSGTILRLLKIPGLWRIDIVNRIRDDYPFMISPIDEAAEDFSGLGKPGARSSIYCGIQDIADAFEPDAQ